MRLMIIIHAMDIYLIPDSTDGALMVSDPGCRFVKIERHPLRREHVHFRRCRRLSATISFTLVGHSPSFIHLTKFIFQGIIIRTEINAKKSPIEHP